MAMPKMLRSPIFEKNLFPAENAGNMPETAFFLQILFGLFLFISLNFHLKTLLIAMLTIKHGSIVIKTDFCINGQSVLKQKKVLW